MDAGVSADNLAGGGDELARGVGHGLVLLVEVGGEEGGVVAAGDEADLLRIGLGGDGEARLGGQLADGWLLHFAEGKEGVAELVLSEAEEEVGLVFRAIGGAGEDPAVADGVEAIASVVASGDAAGADLAGGDQELIELDVIVAEGAGDGGAAGEVVGDEGLDDVGLEALLLIDEVVRDAELFGDAAGIVDVVDGAAAALDLLGHAVVTGESTLVPKLEGEADEGVSLRTQEGGDGGGVDASGHGYGNSFGLEHLFLFSQRSAGMAGDDAE